MSVSVQLNRGGQVRRTRRSVLAHGFVVGGEYMDRVEFLVEDGLYWTSSGIPYMDADGVTLYGSEDDD